MSDFLKNSVDAALSAVGIRGNHWDIDPVRELIHDQTQRLASIVKTSEMTTAFLDLEMVASSYTPRVLWIGTASHIIRLDLSGKENQEGTGFNARLIRFAEISNLEIKAEKWWNETPGSESSLTVSFRVVNELYTLIAKPRNVQQLRRFAELIVSAGATVGGM